MKKTWDSEKIRSDVVSSMAIQFNIGDVAVYPGHGVGRVTAIETIEMLGMKQNFYVINMLETGCNVKIPKDNVHSVGLRPIISKDQAQEVITILKEKSVKVDKQTWNRRHREYMVKINTGSVFEIAEVLRDLFLMKEDKQTLSDGEKRMLEKARKRLLKELTLATSQEELFKEDEMREIFGVM